MTTITTCDPRTGLSVDTGIAVTSDAEVAEIAARAEIAFRTLHAPGESGSYSRWPTGSSAAEPSSSRRRKQRPGWLRGGLRES